MDTPIRPLAKSSFLVTRLTIVDFAGELIERPYKLQEGGNTFRCIATYVDGSTSFYMPYWTCPILLRSGGYELWTVFGRQRLESVTVHASKPHERYTELACWVFEPASDGRNEIEFDSTGFDYSLIEAL